MPAAFGLMRSKSVLHRDRRVIREYVVGEFLLALISMWPIHAIAAAIIGSPAMVIARKRVKWTRQDISLLAVPWMVWFVTFAFGKGAASLSSAMVENVLLGLVLGVSVVTQAILSAPLPVDYIRKWSLGSLTVIAMLLSFYFPFLGE
jgi:hypothetical protein